MSTATHLIPPESRQFKNLILNVRTPQVFKGITLGWTCFTQDLSEWASLFDSASQNSDGVTFDCGPLQNGSLPQWERKRGARTMTATEFVKKFEKNSDQKEAAPEWASFSYKQLDDLPRECREGISFEQLGFKDSSDFTFWLGSAGAHTPCHYDTYGRNVVVQVFGRKSWLLFPPSTALKPTRVPYEESSVYCQENFFSPTKGNQFNSIEEDAYHIVLEPGDVLVVPPKWWHYVESLDTSLAINKWIPLINDLDAQIDECLVKINVIAYTHELNEDMKRALINPNELNTLYTTPLVDHLRLISLLKRLQADEDLHRQTIRAHSSNYLSDDAINRLLDEHPNVIAVAKLTRFEFKEFLEKNGKRFDAKCDAKDQFEQTEEYRLLVEFINMTCCAESIKAMNKLTCGNS